MCFFNWKNTLKDTQASHLHLRCSKAKKILTFQWKNALRVSLFASIKATGILRPFSSLSHMPGSSAHFTQTGDSERIPTVRVQKTWEPGDGGEMKGITDLWQRETGENGDKRQQEKEQRRRAGSGHHRIPTTSHSCSHLAAIHAIPVTIHSLKSHFLFTFTQTGNLESRPGNLSLPSMLPASHHLWFGSLPPQTGMQKGVTSVPRFYSNINVINA